MFDLANLDRMTDLLVSRAGGYLRNTVREAGATCQVCATPVDGYRRCFPCRKHESDHGRRLADAVGALTYAIEGKQTGYAMRGYKAAKPLSEHTSVVSLLTWTGIGLHGRCAGVRMGAPVTHWAAVPSLPPKPAPHPFRAIAAAVLPGDREVGLRGVSDVADPRAAAVDHFTTLQSLPRHSHVLVLDDTWTQGGHAQSAVLALRRSGAATVSVLTAARWLNPRYGDNSEFVAKRLTADFTPRQCPWTGGDCP